MAVRKKLQKLGNSRVLLLDRDLLEVLLPDGDLEQTLLVEVAGDALVVRRETAAPLSPLHVARASERAVNLPSLHELSLTEQRILDALRHETGNTSEVARRVERSRPTTSLALNRLLEAGWVRKTGRDWHLATGAKQRLEHREPEPYAHLSPAVARLCRALEAGPATAAELEARLGVTRGAVLQAIKQASAAGLVRRDDLPKRVPAYSLRARP